jgi:heat shock protein HslJ
MPDFRLPARAALSGLAALMIQGCAMLLDLAPIPLPDGKWELVTATFAETGRVPGAPRATLAFQGGRIAAFSGCNSASGAVRGVESRLEVQQLIVTRRGCPEPLAWFEARFFKMLRAGPSYHVDGAVLALTAGTDRARFRRATEP